MGLFAHALSKAMSRRERPQAQASAIRPAVLALADVQADGLHRAFGRRDCALYHRETGSAGRPAGVAQAPSRVPTEDRDEAAGALRHDAAWWPNSMRIA
jgi:hypothetical protein